MGSQKLILIILGIVLIITGVVATTAGEAPKITLSESTPTEPILSRPPNNIPKQLPFVCNDIPKIKPPAIESIRKSTPESYGPLGKTQNIFSQPILGGYFLSSEPNASLAAQALNGYVIQPGTVFSFNNAVGERTPEKGYAEGWVVSGNTYKKEIGGGICRVSTALYNAALSAGLPIIESSPHTMPVRYASRGKDAAVYYSVLDLKFQNNLNIPVVIKTAEQNGKLFLALTNVPGEPPENIAKANITTTESSMETPGEIFREDQVENQTRAQIKNQVIEEAERWGVTYW